MKPQFNQPQASQLQSIQQAYQTGQLALALDRAQQLARTYPRSLPVLNWLGMCFQAQGQLREAAEAFAKMLALNPNIAEIHCNLGAIYTQLRDTNGALAAYRQALRLKPDLTVAHFNVGALLQQEQQWQDASEHYRQAVTQQPGFYQAWVNWGAVLQTLGELQPAEQCYRRALAIQQDALGYFNLGTNLYDQGAQEQAIEAFREALRLDPQFADAWNDLGEIYRNQGNMEEAVRCYRAALQANPQHDRANYNLGESYCLGGQLEQAIPYFKVSNFADAHERILLCLYKTRRFDEFKQRLHERMAQNSQASVLLGSLAAHYATNFQEPIEYRYCRSPMDFVWHTQIAALAEPGSALLNQLLYDIQHIAIAERKQGRLYQGMQSAGNLLQRAESSFQQLAAVLRESVQAYQQRFADSEDSLIRLFPTTVEFASSWFLRMTQGGYLTSHIHEEGWISGCVYLQLPDPCDRHEGCFEYGLDGDDYPCLHDAFPRHIVAPKVGDLVLFPSSLFHRTLPFNSAQERICIAFDIKPGSNEF